MIARRQASNIDCTAFDRHLLRRVGMRKWSGRRVHRLLGGEMGDLDTYFNDQKSGNTKSFIRGVQKRKISADSDYTEGVLGWHRVLLIKGQWSSVTVRAFAQLTPLIDNYEKVQIRWLGPIEDPHFP